MKHRDVFRMPKSQHLVFTLCIFLVFDLLINFILVSNDNTFLFHSYSKVNRSIKNNKPLCKEGVLQRMKNSKMMAPFYLLTNGEDPQQQHRNCQLHYYKSEDVVACFDRLNRVWSKQNQPLHFAFVGDSTIREQYESFVRVMN